MRQLIEAGNPAKSKLKKPGARRSTVLSMGRTITILIFIKGAPRIGKIVPVIDACYPLNKTPEDFWYFEKEHPKGKVVIRVV